MFWSLLVAGLCYLIDGDQKESTARLGAVATFIYIFAAFYSPGMQSHSWESFGSLLTSIRRGSRSVSVQRRSFPTLSQRGRHGVGSRHKQFLGLNFVDFASAHAACPEAYRRIWVLCWS